MLQRTAQGEIQIWGPENFHPSVLLSLLHGCSTTLRSPCSWQITHRSNTKSSPTALSGAWLAKSLAQSVRGVPGVLTEIRLWVAERVVSIWEAHRCFSWLFLFSFFPAMWMMEFTGCHCLGAIGNYSTGAQNRADSPPVSDCIQFLYMAPLSLQQHAWRKKDLVAFLFRSAVIKPLSSACLLSSKLLMNLHFGPSSIILCTTEIQGTVSSKMGARKSMQKLETSILLWWFESVHFPLCVFNTLHLGHMFLFSSICLLDCFLTLACFLASVTEGKLIFHLFRKYPLLSQVLLLHLLLCDHLKSLVVSLFQLIKLHCRLYFNLIANYHMMYKLEREEQKDESIFPLSTIPLFLYKHTSSVLTYYWWQHVN